MKLVTAAEARGLMRGMDDALERVITAINKRVNERAGTGNFDSLIGYTGETEIFSRLSEGDRASIATALRFAGYGVTDGPSPKTIKITWRDYESEA